MSAEKSTACRVYREAKREFTSLSIEASAVIADPDTPEDAVFHESRQKLTLAYSKLQQAAEDYQLHLSDIES